MIEISDSDVKDKNVEYKGKVIIIFRKSTGFKFEGLFLKDDGDFIHIDDKFQGIIWIPKSDIDDVKVIGTAPKAQKPTQEGGVR